MFQPPRSHRLIAPPLGLLGMMVFGPLASARADWRDDIGYHQLAAELGASMPTGSGIPLLQSEANTVASPPDYLPEGGGPDAFFGSGPFADKTFHPVSGTGTALGHAASVASYFYGNYFGIAPGATEIHNYTATDFIERLTSANTPEVFPGRVQNHSWAGSLGSSTVDTNVLRRLDFMIHRDGSIVAIPLFNNELVMQPLLGNNYNAITTGLRSGVHSQTGTNTDGNGRMKPDLVVNMDLTSNAAPVVAGTAAALLQEAVASGNANAEKPQTLKAIMLAAASKKNLPQWQRDADAEPYDDIYGAGELHLRNAWHIQHADEQGYSTTAEVAPRGWDFATTTTATGGRRYFFSISAGTHANTFSAALTWHRNVTQVVGNYFSDLSNLSLRLYAAESFTTGAVISASTSSVDNVEHLFLYNLPPGQYALEVSIASGSRDYALAWDAQAGQGPRLKATPVAAGEILLQASDLDPHTTYIIESSLDLFSPWTTEHTFRTADTTPAFQASWRDVTAPPERKFYRLKWTAVR